MDLPDDIMTILISLVPVAFSAVSKSARAAAKSAIRGRIKRVGPGLVTYNGEIVCLTSKHVCIIFDLRVGFGGADIHTAPFVTCPRCNTGTTLPYRWLSVSGCTAAHYIEMISIIAVAAENYRELPPGFGDD